MGWPVRAAIEPTAWSSTAGTATRSSTTAAATAAGSSTPSPARPCTAQAPPSELVLILRGFAQGVPTAQLARELGCDRSELLRLRHRLQDLAFENRDDLPLDDPVLEADEAYQNAGEKGVPHATPRTRRGGGPTRRRGTAPGRTTGRRSAAWPGGRAVRSG